MSAVLKNILKIILSLSVLIGLFFTELKLLVNKQEYKKELIDKTTRLVREKELQFLSINNAFFSDTVSINGSFELLLNLANENNIGVSVFSNDTLVFWNNNLLNTQKYKSIMTSGTRFLLANNGFYLAHYFKYGKYALLQYYQIKTYYQYQNQYIKNYFNSDFSFLGSAIASPSHIEGFTDISDSKGNFLFALKVYDEERDTPYWLILLILLVLCLNCFYFHVLIKKLLSKNIALGSLLFFLFTLGAKYVLLYFKLPVFLYKYDLFKSDTYASSVFIPSLGDFILTVLLVLWYFFLIEGVTYYQNKNRFGLVKLIFSALITITLIDSVLDGIKSLVRDSQLTFDLQNVYGLNFHSFAALFLSILLILIVYLTCKHFYRLILVQHYSTFQKIVFSGFSILFIHPFIVKYLFERNQYHPYINALVLIVFVVYFSLLQKRLNKLQQYFISALLFSAFAGIAIQYWDAEKEKEKRELFADKLIAQNDINTEDFLRQVESRIINDKEVMNYFANPFALQMQLQRRLRQLYFTGYLSKYDITIFDYDSQKNFYRDRSPYFFRQIDFAYNELSNETISKRFKLLKNTAFIKGYLGKFEIIKNNEIAGYLFIQLSPKLLADENRFDELLIEGFRTIGRRKNNEYSYAIYRENKLQTHSGLFNYKIENDWSRYTDKVTYVNQDGYNHLIKNDGFNGLVVVSKKLNPIYGPFALFSLYFTMFSILFLVVLFLYYFLALIKSKVNFDGFLSKISFITKLKKLLEGVEKSDVLLLRSKIQLTLVMIVFFTLITTAFFTINIINSSYTDKQTDKLVKKLRSVVSAIQTEILFEKSSTNKIETDAYLNQIGDYYETDITFFDANGQLVGSTISKLYDYGIIAPVINAQAYKELKINKQSRYLNNEYIATFEFVGAYLSVVNKSKEVIGYVMLPYFNSKADLYAEISGIIVGFINLYAFLFIVIGIIAWLIGRSISYPLAIIQKQFSKVSLSRKNEPLHWRNNDEIGQLVKQYNSMIDELEKSAELLAKSERESAWRDIARQIAHEIKNPLTPMKLSVQHLERAWNDNHPALPQTFKKVTKTLITQIDVLSELAAEFSNYAKMPVPKISKVNVQSILQNQISMYEHTFNGTIHLIEPNFDTTIDFDEGFLNRTFSNLIKNAIQAIPEDIDGLIEVKITQSDKGLTISITDNGCGISEELAEKIFTPYYSTKTFGMGLGLPIVKNMIESGGGKIWFESQINKGTTFYVFLPFLHT
ncbi:MAG: ATP-binding protein [Bacteroidia bacterium]